MVSIQNLHKKFGKNTVLAGIDFSLEENGVIGVLGPNGSGKTTLIKSILGMVISDSGTISVQKNDIKKKLGIPQKH